uniref:Transmembrane protein INAFM2 n=1 Tax=Plectus sambesii TaxID=2011161 RepID=A0A914W4K8_9BILA
MLNNNTHYSNRIRSHNKQPVYTSDKRAKFTQRENKKWIRLATVFGYIISVCSPAVGLSIYYIYVWDPKYIERFPSPLNASKIPPPQVPLPPMPTAINRPIRGGLDAYISHSNPTVLNENLSPIQNDAPASTNKQCDCNCNIGKTKPGIPAPKVKANLGLILQSSHKPSDDLGEQHDRKTSTAKEKQKHP